MIVFLILATILVAGALLLVIPPMLGAGARARDRAHRQEQARTVLVVLREQLAELEAERSAGRIAEADYQRSREELEQRVLAEAGIAEAGEDARPARAWAVGLVLTIPVLAVAVYLVMGSPEGLDPAKIQPPPEAGHQITPEQMQGMVAQLAERLVSEPDNVEGWLMLGRSYGVMRDLQGAMSTWSRIGERIPDHPDVLADWADLLATAGGRKFDGDPDRLIERALKLDPNHVKALALGGTSAFQRGDYAKASQMWERILEGMQPGQGPYDSILASINEARAKGGLPQLLPEGAKAAGLPATSELAVRGKLSIAPALTGGVKPDDVVFVFARPMGGGMPIAALRFRAAELPREFDFSEAQRMSQGPLPPQISVGARVAKQGSATASAGDLESVAVVVSPDAKGIELQIDRVRN